MRESNRMLPFREGNHTCPQRHKYSEMVGTHHPVGARSIVAGRFWAVRGGETTPRYGCEHATAYSRMAPVPFSSSKLVLTFRPVCGGSRGFRSRRVSMIGAALGPQSPGRQLSRRVRADTAAGSCGIATIFSVFLICHPSSRPAPYRRRRHGASYMHQGTRY